MAPGRSRWGSRRYTRRRHLRRRRGWKEGRVAAWLVGIIWFVWWIGRWAVEVKVKVGLVGVEVSTGDVVYGEFEDDALRSGLESVVLSLSPVEILLGEPLTKQTRKLLLAYAGPASNARVERASRECFEDGGALAELMSLYENLGEATLRLANEQDGETGETDRHLLGVEILTNNFDGTEKGTLFQVLNHTQTAFGVRLLRQGLSSPVL